MIKYFSNRTIHWRDANIGTCSWLCLRCFFTFYDGKLPLNHHLAIYYLLVPSILSKSKCFKHSSIRFVSHTDSLGFSQINQFWKFLMLSKGVLQTATQYKEGISIYIVYIYIHSYIFTSCDSHGFYSVRCSATPSGKKDTHPLDSTIIYIYIYIIRLHMHKWAEHSQEPQTPMVIGFTPIRGFYLHRWIHQAYQNATRGRGDL